MMKLLRSSNLCRYTGISRVLFFSSRTLPSLASTDSLHNRLSRARDPNVSIVPVLDQWVGEGRNVMQPEIRRLIMQLKSYRRPTLALELSEWMSKGRHLKPSPGDVAVHLDLISSVHGIEQVETYFESIPEPFRDFKVYCALLNCYAQHKCLEKAEGIMQKLRELGALKTPVSYHVMLNLYSELEKYEKIDILMQEMEEKGVGWDKLSYTIQLNAYVSTSDIEKMEKLLIKMEADPGMTMFWYAYVIAGNGYLKSGLTEKVHTVLKKSENVITGKTRRFAYPILLTMYASIGNKDEVYRIWSLYKNIGRLYNTGYLCMISSLVKLDDIDGAEMILKEWELGDAGFDLQVPDWLVDVYNKVGFLERAEAFVDRLFQSRREAYPSTWDRLAAGYRRDDKMEKAVEAMKKAILVIRPEWKPNRGTLIACFEFLKGKGDVEVAGEFIRLLKEQGHFTMQTYERLENYINNGNPGSLELDYVGGGDEMAEGGARELKYASIS